MKDIKEHYEPITADLRQALENFRNSRKYIRIHYFTDIHEYISTAAIIKDIYWQQEAAFMMLNTGEEVRLDRIVRLDGQLVPGYDIQDFTCDC